MGVQLHAQTEITSLEKIHLQNQKKECFFLSPKEINLNALEAQVGYTIAFNS